MCADGDAYVPTAAPRARSQKHAQGKLLNRQKLPKGSSFTMKTWVRKSLNVGVLSAGFLLVAGSAANANVTTANNGGLATGNQVGAAAKVPVTVRGNANRLRGVAQASCRAGSSAAPGSAAPGA